MTTRHRRRAWLVAALAGAVLTAAALMGHLLAASVTDDRASISTSESPVDATPALVDEFRAKLAPGPVVSSVPGSVQLIDAPRGAAHRQTVAYRERRDQAARALWGVRDRIP